MTAPGDGPSAELPSDSEREDFLEEFRGLGGVADNVAPGPGTRGHGLRVHDPTKPFLLCVPDNLLFRTSNIEFAGDTFRIKDGASVQPREREFLVRYQKIFPWQDRERAEAAKFVAMLDSLPPEARATLSEEFGMQAFLEGDPNARARSQLLRRRTINWNGEAVIAPFLELAERSGKGAEYNSDVFGRLRIAGQSAAEIRIGFGQLDAVGIFRKFGVAVQRPHAFSLPMTIMVGTIELIVARNLPANIPHSGLAVPNANLESNKLQLPYLMVGNADRPRASRGIFGALMRKVGVSGANETFDTILHVNKAKYLGLLENLEPYRVEMVTRLRRMAYFQLEALAQCVGTRWP